MRTTLRLSALSLLLCGIATPAFAQLQEGERPTEAQVAAGEAPALRFPEGETALRALRDPASAPRWSKEAARQLLAYIERVGEEGLDPADYAPARLSDAIRADQRDTLNIIASDIFLRLSADLALGHVPAGKAREDWHMQDPDLSANQQFALMEKAVERGNVAETLNGLLPTHPQYAELKGVLANTTAAATRDKVKANLERWRWLPRELGPRYVIVNVPAYTVALVENGQVVARHRAVVGAVRTATPQLSAVATGVILNPWWEIPKSIEPEVRGKRGYVRVPDGAGGYRYRQPPGPGNALGRMKVVMPNNYAIYLHDTPTKATFNRAMRAASHGCIRTQDPLTFARLLLDNPEWDKEAIDRQIASGKTVQAQASTPTPVYIAYFTAAAAAGTGEIVSYRDVYGRDATVLTAMNQRGAPALASSGTD